MLQSQLHVKPGIDPGCLHLLLTVAALILTPGRPMLAEETKKIAYEEQKRSGKKPWEVVLFQAVRLSIGKCFEEATQIWRV